MGQTRDLARRHGASSIIDVGTAVLADVTLVRYGCCTVLYL